MTAIDRAEFNDADLPLREVFSLFARHRNARVLAGATAGAVVTRLGLGKWGKRDAVAALAIVGVEPFVEWMIHVHVLHKRPREVGGRTRDSLLARSHRAHHRDPRDPDLVFIPEPVLLPAMAALAATNLAAARALRPALTGFAAALASMSLYEWTHFLIHSAHRPKTALYRTIRRTHQLHHFRNENYWFGIITPVSDKALNTYPSKDSVPPSGTAKTLGVEI